MEKRKEIDIVNILLCILVMLIHILSRSVASLDKASIQYLAVLVPSRLASFVVQGFIFLSGMKYFMKYEHNDFKYFPFIGLRVRTILLPYILWNVIYYIALMPLGYFDFSILELIKYIIMGNMISHFYFVVIIIQFYLLMPLWILLLKKIDEKLLLILSLVLMIAFGQYLAVGIRYNDRVFLKYIFYWIAGCLAGRHIDWFLGLIRERRLKIIIVYIVIALIDCILTYFNNTREYIAYLEIVHIMYCIVAVVFVFAICGKLRGYVDKAIFGIINRQSYNIYLSHCLVLYYCDGIMNAVGIYSAKGILMVRFLVCYGLTFAMWGLYDAITNRNRV